MEDLGIDGRILKWILRNSVGKAWTGFLRFGIRGHTWRAVVNTVMNCCV